MLNKMADETVDCTVLVLMSSPILISENCDISIRRMNVVVPLVLMLMPQVFSLALISGICAYTYVLVKPTLYRHNEA